MGCLFIIIGLITPRILMFFIFLLTNWFSIAFSTIIWPLLGFFILPYTTLAYTVAMVYNHHQISGGWLILLVIAVIVDITGHSSYRRMRW